MALDRNTSGVHYEEYLQLDKVLSAQYPLSQNYGQMAHDEMLFIVVHQAHELWFKQILTEISSVISIFAEQTVNDKHMNLAVARLARVTDIQKLLVDHLRILESMTPHDFLEFRRFLNPASGFQSAQFRMLESSLGYLPSGRFATSKCIFANSLKESDAAEIHKRTQEPTLFSCIEKWLERTPFLTLEDFDFWSEYRVKTLEMKALDKSAISKNSALPEEEKLQKYLQLDSAYSTFDALFSEEQFNQERTQGLRRLSFNATKAALFINLYRDIPVLQLPFKVLTSLINIDELLQIWRAQHATMVHRMIGIKIGTGGSMGYNYLQSTLSQSRVFSDFASLSTYLIPRELLPTIPEKVLAKMSFPQV
jgi:tryptophan 2,3-dioxygenase